MDLELASDEEEQIAGQDAGQFVLYTVVDDAAIDTSPERRQRSRSRRISFAREDVLATVVAVITPRSQRQDRPAEPHKAPLDPQRDADQCAATTMRPTAARCLQLLLAEPSTAAPPTSQHDISVAVSLGVTPRRISTVFELDEPVPASTASSEQSSPQAHQRARVLRDWGCLASASERILPPSPVARGRQSSSATADSVQSWNAVTERIITTYLVH